jgi:uncharacterized SAM-binding protein YcdF (DUF218 family)
MNYSQPLLPLFLLLCFAGILRQRRTAGKRSALAFAGLAGLFLCMWPPAAWLAAYSVERWVPVIRYPASDAQAVVVLSANMMASGASEPEALPGYSTYVRAAHASWLFHHWRQTPIVVCGGPAVKNPDEPTLAEVMRRQLVESGVPDSMVWVEDKSETTYENALFAANILRPKAIRKIVLVTEAFHMPRAELVLRKLGFEVTPVACSYRTMEKKTVAGWLTPSFWAIRVNEEALHEIVGLAWYKLRGWI